MTGSIDPNRSRIEFAVRHMMFSTVRGRFTEFAGSVSFDEQEPALSAAEGRIRVASLTTGDRERDAAVISPDFLDAPAFPEIIFRSRRVQSLAADRGRITGDLTIRDVTGRVTLEARYLGQTEGRARFAATTTLSRKEWGLAWGPVLEAGGLLVGDEIKVSVEVEVVEESERASG